MWILQKEVIKNIKMNIAAIYFSQKYKKPRLMSDNQFVKTPTWRDKNPNLEKN